MTPEITGTIEQTNTVKAFAADCPAELLALDRNAAQLWPKLLKKSGATVDRTTKEIVQDRRGSILCGIGVPDLVFRLECQREREKGGAQNEVARAKIWFHIAEACAPGDSIPDLTSDNRYLLNPWIVTKALKFPDPRFQAVKQPQAEKPSRYSLEYRQAKMRLRQKSSGGAHSRRVGLYVTDSKRQKQQENLSRVHGRHSVAVLASSTTYTDSANVRKEAR
jgi:hypothetical protein